MSTAIKQPTNKLVVVKSPSTKIESGSGEKIRKQKININFILEIDEFEINVLQTLLDNGQVAKVSGDSIYLYEKKSKTNPDPSSWSGSIDDVSRLMNFGLIEFEDDNYFLTKLGKSIKL